MKDIYIIKVDYEENSLNLPNGWSEIDNPHEDREFGAFGPYNSFDPVEGDPTLMQPFSERYEAEIFSRWWRTGNTDKNSPDAFDFYSKTAGMILKWALVEAIEELDPDLHTIYEAPRIWSVPANAPLNHKFGLVHVRRRIRTVDVERSNTYVKNRYQREETYITLMAQIKESRVVYEDAAMQGYHIWSDDLTRQIFCTEEFRQRFLEVGCQGLRFEECTVIEN